MEIVCSLGELRSSLPSAVALGAFDGLHKGHMAVIRAAVQKGESLQSAVLTFARSPSGKAELLTGEEKEKLLKEAGVRRMYSLEFSELKEWDARRFVKEILFEKCGARLLCCGEDFRFGKGREGDVSLLGQLCERQGASLIVVPPVKEGGEKISSTRIRLAVEQGEISLANKLLGRPFGFFAEVIHGNHIGGPILGTPTLNQAVPENFCLPPFGVYSSWVQVGGDFFYGVTNIGVKPTVGSDRVLAETYLPGFSGDLYGRKVRLCLLEFIRPEKKFSSLEELKEEIKRNARSAEKSAKSFPPPCFGLE